MGWGYHFFCCCCFFSTSFCFCCCRCCCCCCLFACFFVCFFGFASWFFFLASFWRSLVICTVFLYLHYFAVNKVNFCIVTIIASLFKSLLKDPIAKFRVMFWLKFTSSFYINDVDQTSEACNTKFGPHWKDQKSSYQVRPMIELFCELVALCLG